MFICHKCGYQDLSDKEKTSCPICGANIIVPKGALILFLSLISFIVFCIISVFFDHIFISFQLFITHRFIITQKNSKANSFREFS